MQREDHVEYWRWFYNQNGQINQLRADALWRADKLACCNDKDVLPGRVFPPETGCTISDFGLDATSDIKLNVFIRCIFKKLREKGTNLNIETDLRCFSSLLNKLAIFWLVPLIFSVHN